MTRDDFMRTVRKAYAGEDETFNAMSTSARSAWAVELMRAAHVEGHSISGRWGVDALAAFGWLQGLWLDAVIEKHDLENQESEEVA